MKRVGGRITMVLAMMMLLTCVYTLPVNAASKPDLKKANVKWDLKNNKKLKFKTTWSIGVKEHTVKMTKFKVKKAKKKGYKECTFTVTFNRKINPTAEQVKEMKKSWDDKKTFAGSYYVTVMDYKTGKCLERKNTKKIKVTFPGGWKHSNKKKFYYDKGKYLWVKEKSTIKCKIVYPKNYKNLAIGVGGCTVLKPKCNSVWNGKKKFSKATELWSKEDRNFAHFMRVKK